MADALLCAKQVAALLSVGEPTARRLFRSGEIAAFRVGKARLWRTTNAGVADYITRRLQEDSIPAAPFERSR